MVRDHGGLLEDVLVSQRAYELSLGRVQGRYDVAHLQAFHRYLFQDLPAHGLDHLSPGEFREPLVGPYYWTKARGFETISASLTVGYSRMDDTAIERLGQALVTAQPEALRGLSTEAFTDAMASFYAEADYVHPFREGNSRTLRAFTAQLAEDAGFELRWAQFVISPNHKDLLCLVRDREVSQRLFAELPWHGDMHREIQYSLDMTDAVQPLREVLAGVIRPVRDKELVPRARLQVPLIDVIASVPAREQDLSSDDRHR